MKMKIKTITLTGPWHNDPDSALVINFRVIKITDSVGYQPGQFLAKEIVQSLCEAPDWNVTIVPVKVKDD